MPVNSKELKTKHKYHIGAPLKIKDKNGNTIHVGDIIEYYGETCIVLYDSSYGACKFFITNTRLYGDDANDPESYGKAYDIHSDDKDFIEIII